MGYESWADGFSGELRYTATAPFSGKARAVFSAVIYSVGLIHLAVLLATFSRSSEASGSII